MVAVRRMTRWLSLPQLLPPPFFHGGIHMTGDMDDYE
jgi:hypothetical protein